MDILRKGYVYVNNIYAGIIIENEDGYSFTYDKDYLNLDNPKPVSLTFPLQEKTFNSNYLFPFFDGLIPEGWLLNVVTKNWKITPNDRFGLLLVCCKDPIGNVMIKGEN
jgi:serine/threonine-protein kinase HipA